MVVTLLHEKHAAEVLGVQPQTLRKWRCVGDGPQFVKIGRSIRYDLADLDAFIDANKRTSTSDRGEASQ